jgi:adenylate cyclase
MAVFSAPHQTPGDARKAVESALDQQEIIGELSKRWHDRGKIPFTVGMGINTGYVVMGNLGAQKRMNYTVIGDEVNVAARLYSIAAGGQIIVSHSTYEEVRDYFEFRELEPVTVKGKAAPLRVFEVLGRKSESVALPHMEMVQ